MNKEDLFRSIGLLPDDLVLEADGPVPAKRTYWRRWGTLAVCAAIALLLIYQLLGMPGIENTNLAGQSVQDQQTAGAEIEAGADSEQEKLAPVTLGWNTSGFGFEGIMAYTAAELENNCPWTEGESELTSLPVYRNQNKVLADGAVQFGLDEEEMRQYLRELAGALGYEVGEIEISPSEEQVQKYRERLEEQGRDPDTDPNYEINVRPYSATASAAGAEFQVSTTGEFTMTLQQPIMLPEEYRLSQNSTANAAERTALYLAQQYAGALGVEDPQPQVSIDYSATGEKKISLKVRSGSDTVRQLLEYSFGGLEFYLNEAGEYTGLRLWGTQPVGESLGEYPIITDAQAADLLAQGRCYTSVTEPFPGIEYLAQVELVYREGISAVVPYYRFWVELPTLEQENGLHTYGAYYVPAVAEEYLADPPLSQWKMGD